MANDSDEALSLFEAPPAAEPAAGEHHPAAPRRQGNPLAVAGAALSFLPPVGLALSVVGYRRARSRGGAGRMAAQIGVALSVVLGGVEAYVGSTAPMLDSGCLNADSPASRLQAIQAAPTGDLTALSAELDSIHTALAGAAASAGSYQVRTRLQVVATDVKALSADVATAHATGAISQMITDETRLQADGAAANSYCHSL